MVIRRLSILVAAACALMASVRAQDQPPAAPNPNQAALDELNRRTALLEAQAKLLAAETALANARFPAFDPDIGKKGTLTIEESGRDVFHVTARSAAAFEAVAAKIAGELVEFGKGDKGIVILSDEDRAAMALYMGEREAVANLDRKVKPLLGTTLGAQGVGVAVAGVGAALSQFAQFTQLFRTDKSVSFTESLLPDTLIADLVSSNLRGLSTKETPNLLNVRYPAAELDRLFLPSYSSRLLEQLKSLLDSRAQVSQKGERAAAALAELDALAARLFTVDATSKLPMLFSVLHGELAAKALEEASFAATINVVSKGGTSMKTSNIFTSDRLYAAGGVIVAYRVATTGPASAQVRAKVNTEKTSFVRVDLN